MICTEFFRRKRLKAHEVLKVVNTFRSCANPEQLAHTKQWADRLTDNKDDQAVFSVEWRKIWVKFPPRPKPLKVSPPPVPFQKTT